MPHRDEQIKKDVVDELYWDDRVDASKITVTVNKGTVTLGGEVPSYGDLTAARAAAWSIKGVVELIDEIQVSLMAVPELPSDLELEDRANNILIYDRAIDEAYVKAVVNGAVVTLEGTVDAHWKKFYVEERINALFGIIGIENRLSVVPTKEAADENVAREIVRAMERDTLVDPEEITVEVKHGMVTLSGRVRDAAARLAACNDASKTAGVIDVRDTISVISPM